MDVSAHFVPSLHLPSHFFELSVHARLFKFDEYDSIIERRRPQRTVWPIERGLVVFMDPVISQDLIDKMDGFLGDERPRAFLGIGVLDLDQVLTWYASQWVTGIPDRSPCPYIAREVAETVSSLIGSGGIPG